MENNTGGFNTAIGSHVGQYSQGNANVYIGYHTGYNAVGNGNIALGYMAMETGSPATINNQLFINNGPGNRWNSLIWGSFKSDPYPNADTLRFNGTVAIGKANGAGDAYLMPRTTPLPGQVLTGPSSGKTLQWITPAGGGGAENWTQVSTRVYPTTATQVIIGATSAPSYTGPFYVKDWFRNSVTNPTGDLTGNIAIGYKALYSAVENPSQVLSAHSNVAIGNNTGGGLVSGSHNTLVGHGVGAGLSAQTDISNTVIGCGAFTTLHGTLNTIIGGHNAPGVFANNSSTGNVILGESTVDATWKGSYNTIIGLYAGVGLGNFSKKLLIGPGRVGEDVRFTTPIYGDYHTYGSGAHQDSTFINGWLGITDTGCTKRAFIFPRYLGNPGEVLMVPESGNVLKWDSAYYEHTGGTEPGDSYWKLTLGKLHPVLESRSVAIGQTATNDLFEVRDRIRFDSTNSSCYYGFKAGISSVGEDNTYTGTNAAISNVYSDRNVVIGSNAMTSWTTGNDNTSVGAYSLSDNANNSQTTAIGSYSGYGSSGEDNTFVGTVSGFQVFGDGNTIVGKSAGYNGIYNRNIILGMFAGIPADNDMLYIGNQYDGEFYPIVMADMVHKHVTIGGDLSIRSILKSRDTSLLSISGGHLDIGDSRLETFSVKGGYQSISGTRNHLHFFTQDSMSMAVGTGRYYMHNMMLNPTPEYNVTYDPGSAELKFSPITGVIEDLFVVEYCDGCATETGWIASHDTLYIDTSGGVSASIAGDTLFIGSDTIVFSGDKVWSKTGNYVYTTNLANSVGIKTNTPRADLDVNGNMFIGKAFHAEGGDGDANGDGYVNSVDAAAVSNYFKGTSSWNNNLFRGYIS